MKTTATLLLAAAIGAAAIVRADTALYFDGSTWINTKKFTEAKDSASLSAWVRVSPAMTNNPPTGQVNTVGAGVVGQGYWGSTTGLGIMVTSGLKTATTDDDGMSYQVRNGNTISSGGNNDSTLYTADAWHHYLLVRDKDGGKVYFYVDGELATTSDFSTTLSISPTTTFAIGKNSSIGGGMFRGYIAEVALWDVALTAADAAMLFVCRPSDLDSPPVAYFPFDEGGGATTVGNAVDNASYGATAGALVWVDDPTLRRTKTETILDIAAAPTAYAEPTPSCGTRYGLADNEVVQVACPSVWTNQDATLCATCTGWKLYDVEGNVVSNGAETAFTYVHPSPAAYRRLEWQWRTERLRYVVNVGDVAPCYTNVSVAFSCADPADDQGGGYFSPGAQLTLSVTDPEGRFSDWYGVLPAGVDATSRTISWTVESDSTIRPRLDGWVFPEPAASVTSWYVDFANGSNANDGHSWAASLADFSNALARARADYDTTQRKQYVFLPERLGETQTIPKTHTITTSDKTICYITLDFPVVIQGAGRRETVQLNLSRYANHSDSQKAGVFKIAHADAALRNLTLTGMPSHRHSYLLYIATGAFDNCALTKNSPGDYYALAAPIYLQDGMITNCLISENTMQTISQTSDASGIYMTGGLVTHSVICSNKCTKVAYGGGVCMRGGTIRNSLIFANEAIRYASGVYANPTATCLIENCTIADNVTKDGTTYEVYGLRAAGSSATKKVIVRNTIVYGNSGNTVETENTMNICRESDTYVELYNNLSTTSFEDSGTASGNVVGDPRFSDPESGDYRPVFSAAIDAGQAQDWMAMGTDLSGGPRIVGSGVDIGAYEGVAAAALDAYCTLSSLNPAPNEETTLAAYVSGGTAPYSYRWLVDGAIVAEGADKATYGYIFPGGHHTVAIVVTDASNASVTSQAPGIVTVYLTDTYVATDGSDTEPYDTPAKAARNIIDAFNLTGAGGTVHVLPGNYALSTPVNFVRSSVAIRSTEGPEKTVFTVAPGVAAFALGAPNSILDGITVQGFTTTAINFNEANCLVTNCVVRHGTSRAIYVGFGGTLANCTIQGVTNSSDIVYQRTGVDVLGDGRPGVYVNCRFLDNCSTGSEVLIFYSRGMTIRNCLFARNRSTKSNIIRVYSVYMGAGTTTVESCTFADNVGADWAILGKSYDNRVYFRNNLWFRNVTVGGGPMPALGVSGYLVANNCVAGEIDQSSGVWTDVHTTGDPNLRGDYAPRSGSICVNRGLYQSWMDAALDLAGKRRIQGRVVDIGAFERDESGTVIVLR